MPIIIGDINYNAYGLYNLKINVYKLYNDEILDNNNTWIKEKYYIDFDTNSSYGDNSCLIHIIDDGINADINLLNVHD